jgi:hypothetical protein
VATSAGRFTVSCCRTAGRRRLLNGVLICRDCDAGIKMPNANDMTEVDPDLKRWPPA